jgi:hypothetical protein
MNDNVEFSSQSYEPGSVSGRFRAQHISEEFPQKRPASALFFPTKFLTKLPCSSPLSSPAYRHQGRETAMSKEMISIPAGNLLSLAATKSIPHLSALKEKTGVDRKTLRAINEGQPVKTTTLQSIADRLRIPITHLRGSDIPDKNEHVSSNDFRIREIKLQQLDGAALRKLASEADERIWFLNIDQMSDELKATLLKLRKALDVWWEHNNIGPPDERDNLEAEISYIETSIDIDESVAELVQHKLKIFGGSYLFWNKFQPTRDGRQLPILHYSSNLRAALNIVSEKKTSSTVRVYIGEEPPQKFAESELVGIDLVKVGGKTAWSREVVCDEVAAYKAVPF